MLFCFYCSAFSHFFLFEIIIPSLNRRGLISCVLFHAFSLKSISHHHHQENDKLSIGSVGSQGEKISLNLAFGSALFCFDLSSSLSLISLSSSQCKRETQLEGKR
jgi:hypothetical protein